MRVYADNQLTLPASVISIGAFDGMHRGHQTLIKKAVAQARDFEVPAVIYTFNPPPKAVFQKKTVLTSLEEKIELIRQLGADVVVAADFNDNYALQPPAAFIKEMAFLRPEEIWVGPDFQFGKGKQGDAKLLASYFNVHVHPLVTCEKGEVISSSRIRELLLKEEWIQAYQLIGRTQMEMFK